jgi:hypothetical protein
MLRYLLAPALAIPFYGQCQGYVDPHLPKVIDNVPDTASSEGYGPGVIRANGVSVDLYRSQSEETLVDKGSGVVLILAQVDGETPKQVLHFVHQYGELRIAFGFNLLVEPLPGTDKIRCTFSTLTDPDLPWWRRDRDISPDPLPGGLGSVLVNSGDVLSLTTFPLSGDKLALVHYIRFTLADPGTSSAEAPTIGSSIGVGGS